MSPLKTLLILSCLAGLTGCAGGPSDAEVEAAMKARIEDMNSGSGEPGMSVLSAKNTGCTGGTADGTYVCDVDVEISMPPAGTIKKTAHLNMIQEGGAWTYDKQQVLSM
ncbi:MAG: hypothetical protein ACREUQ_02765 [Burkholderiales bacterium]